MQRILEQLRRGPGPLAAALAITVGLAACGPGTGGTGTGPIVAGTSFYGSTADPLAPGLLPCPAGCGTQAELAIGPQRIELGLPCQRFVHEGPWTFDSQGRAEVVGQWTSLQVVDGQSVAVQQPARLVLQQNGTDGDAAAVWLTVSDLAGRTLLETFELERRTTVGAALSCTAPVPAAP